MTTRRRRQSPLGRKLWELRLNQTQQQVADRAGLSLDLVKSLEQGRLINPSLHTLQKLAAALRTTVAELVSGVETPALDE